MIKIDLITGFLGAGKTTFMKKYARFMMDQGMHIGIIENDFGAINVDMLLLQDLEGEFCDVEPIVGGNVASDWKRRFKAKLISLAMQGVQRVLVEPSGIYDVDTFFEVLYDEPVDKWYEIGDVITIVDAKMDTRMSEQAEFLLMSQVANSGQIVFSKVESATGDQIQETTRYLSELLEKYDCDSEVQKKLQSKIIAKSWNELNASDYQKLMDTTWVSASYKGLYFDKNDVFTSLFFMNVSMPQEQIQSRIQQLFQKKCYGTVFRVKGFFHLKDDSWIEVNATRDHYECNQIEKGQEVVIVIGEELDKEAISECFEQN